MVDILEVPVMVVLTPEDLNTIVGALELAPMPHKVTHPVIDMLGKAARAAFEANKEKLAKEKADGQKSDNGGAPNGRGGRPARKTLHAVPRQ